MKNMTLTQTPVAYATPVCLGTSASGHAFGAAVALRPWSPSVKGQFRADRKVTRIEAANGAFKFPGTSAWSPPIV